MKNLITYGSWALLTVALLSWASVVYAGMYLMDQGLVRADALTNAEQQQSRAAQVDRMKALAVESADERSQLEGLSRQDITSIVTILERVGPAAGVTMQISDASVEGSAAHIVDGVTMKSVAFIVSAEGSFANIVKAAKLFENLSLPSVLSQVEFARTGENASSTWRLTGRIRVLTTAPVTI